MMRIRKIVDWRKYEKFRNFGIKKLLWSKMKIERESGNSKGKKIG